MSFFSPGVARPTLDFRGLLGQTEPILIAGGRAVADYREAFVVIDVAKLKNAISVAESGRDGEVRYFGEVEATDASMRRVVAVFLCSVVGWHPSISPKVIVRCCWTFIQWVTPSWVLGGRSTSMP